MKGLTYKTIERKERLQSLKEKTGNTLLILSIGFLLGFWVHKAYGSEAWQLDLYSYRSDQGIGPTTYLDEWRLAGGNSYKECLQIGEEALKDHKAGTIDGAKILGAFSCEAIK